MPLGNPFTMPQQAQRKQPGGFQMPQVQKPFAGGFAGQQLQRAQQLEQNGGVASPEMLDAWRGQLQGNMEMYNEDGTLKEQVQPQQQQMLPEQMLQPWMNQSAMQRITNPIFSQK